MLLATITDILNPIVWTIPGNAARKFYSFSCTEYSSVFDLTLAANLTTSDAYCAAYVIHLQDERRHTSIFWNRANKIRKEKGKPALPHPKAEYEELFKRLGEKRFLAFVHAGEKRGCIQFTSYANYFTKKGDTHDASIFITVLEDETRHMNYTWELLVEVCGSTQAAHTELLKARMWEMRRRWMRAGQSLTGTLFFLITVAVYPLFLPYKLFTRTQSSSQPSWNRQ